nr:leucine-rich repeat domain-containing protein [Lachnospiraceae bacterium]
MRRIIAGKIGRRGVACILAVSLCLTSGFIGGGRERTEPAALAAEQPSEEEVWEYEGLTSGEAKITGYKGTDTQLHIPETIQNSEGDSLAVTEIADNAFKDCTNLISVEIPKSVTKIGIGMLSGCSNIREITVSEENQYYDSREACNAIIEKNTNKLVAGCQTSRIPDDIQIIGEYAFAGCTMLTDVTFPAGLTEIGGYAFEGCSGITSIEIPASVTKIGVRVFAGCNLEEIKVDEENEKYTSGDNCNAIMDSTRLIYGCKNTTIPEGIKSICSYAFNDCAGLESIRIPSTVLWIDSYAFCDCSNLQQIDFAEESSVREIDSYAISGCEKLKSISLPSSITVVLPHTFDGCSSLERVEVPEGVTKLYYSAFEGCSALKEINLPESLTSIGQSAFSGCASLSTVKIPSGITVLETGIFWGCASLTEIELPSSITKICGMAFRGCASLTAVKIPDSVTDIGEYVFGVCDLS